MRRSTLAPFVACALAIACDNTATAPDGAESHKLRPSLQEVPSDQPCVGILPPGRYQNVFVPQGQTCTINGSTLTGNLKALEGSRLFANDNNIAGNVQGDKALDVRLTGGTVGGNVEIVDGRNPDLFLFHYFVAGVTLTHGNIHGINNTTLLIRVNTLDEGDIHAIKNGPSSVSIENNILMKGNIKNEDNVANSPFFNFLNSNLMGSGNIQVFKNKGTASKSVSGNIGGQSVQCKENDPPFTAAGNTAPKQEDQCGPPTTT